MPKVLPEICSDLAPGALVISIVAGARIAVIERDLGVEAIVRAMPNTPGQVGHGMTVWTATPAVTEKIRAQSQAILGALGLEHYVNDEDYLDMATALSGTGPAYVFLFMEALIDAGVHLGFSRRVAQELVYQTVEGSVAMARETGKHPTELRNSVTSPGGTTAEALYRLEKGGLRTVISRRLGRSALEGAGGVSQPVNYMLANFVDVLFQVFFVLILIDILSSWVLAARVNLPAFVYTILGAVHSIVTPVLSPFRRIISSIGGLDFSPIIALVVLQFAQQFIARAPRGLLMRQTFEA